MNKKTTIWIAILILVLLLIFPVRTLLVIDNDKTPGFISNYASNGDFTFDPETILASINQDETNVFTPFDGNPDELPIHNSIDWTPADYLKIANILSQQIWNESLDLEKWAVYFVYFQTDCKDNLQGFNEFRIVYYKSLGIKNWEWKYEVRDIDVFPWQGLIRWGGGTVFSAPLLSAWHDLNWLKFNIAPVNAMQIADQNGGKEERIQVQNICIINVSMNQDGDEIWDVGYPEAYFRIGVNANNGAYKIQYKGQ
jgi:hypothetical protein